ncbi:hypothetical protein MTR62_09400 [Novosphingobium sp. 1949]|uniref:Uncharacterized protein n=1 Tax=Novosphingobium organovorum TaxID=2930092 RepID=A0ABT0BD55_9SPHN|nr:hypothetical protein [Novosphingobium organovorum]MCJ2182904.1 hypothetical protein [Novosphingobium organovorum]
MASLLPVAGARLFWSLQARSTERARILRGDREILLGSTELARHARTDGAPVLAQRGAIFTAAARIAGPRRARRACPT